MSKKKRKEKQENVPKLENLEGLSVISVVFYFKFKWLISKKEKKTSSIRSI